MTDLYTIIDGNLHKCENVYWLGPYGVLVPHTIDWVIAKDGVSMLHKSGIISKNKTHFPGPTADEYKYEYAEYVNEYWIYKSE
jgi:hypothetical protein